MAKPNLGSKIYSPAFLSLMYDSYVLGFSMRYFWRCPTSKYLAPLYAENVSKDHLDIGVGTGYLPIKSFTPRSKHQGDEPQQRITLVDLNENSLQSAKQRISSKHPDTDVSCVIADVTETPPESLQSRTFKSISMMNLLHCVPGPTTRKLAAFNHYSRLLDSDGVLFGCTILGKEKASARNWLGNFNINLYNKKGVFDNLDDDVDTFNKGLNQAFGEVKVWTVGSMLLFKASKPSRP